MSSLSARIQFQGLALFWISSTFSMMLLVTCFLHFQHQQRSVISLMCLIPLGLSSSSLLTRARFIDHHLFSIPCAFSQFLAIQKRLSKLLQNNEAFLSFTIIMFTLNELIQAFDSNLLYAWEVLYAEILMQNSAINKDYLRKLVMLYSKGVQKCNHLQPEAQNYFKTKINSLMGQKKVIQCLQYQIKLNNENIESENGSLKEKGGLKLNLTLQARKKELQMRLAYDIEQSKSTKVAKMLKDEAERQQKLQHMVKKCISSQQEKLQNKIAMRRRRISAGMVTSLKMSVTTDSQCMDSHQNSILDEVPFIDDGDL